jgi:hypothetical protein
VSAGRIILTFIGRFSPSIMIEISRSTRPVQFHEEYALPAAEMQPAVDDVEAGGDGEQERSAMRVAVDTLIGCEIHRPDRGIVMAIGSVLRRGLLEQGREVSMERRFFLVYHNRRRRMQTLDVDESKAKPASATSRSR